MDTTLSRIHRSVTTWIVLPAPLPAKCRSHPLMIGKMTDPFTAANTVRKKRTKWWREHIAFAYLVVIGSFVVVFLIGHFINWSLPRWLTAIGISPSGINLLLGILWCAVGAWGIRTQRMNPPWLILNTLCLLGGLLLLARAFSFA